MLATAHRHRATLWTQDADFDGLQAHAISPGGKVPLKRKPVRRFLVAAWDAQRLHVQVSFTLFANPTTTADPVIANCDSER